MKIAVYSAQPYDRRFLDEARLEAVEATPASPIDAVYFANRLTIDTVPLAHGCAVVCVFVNDILDAEVLEALHALGVRAVLLRCAGFNNVDVQAGEPVSYTHLTLPTIYSV